MSAEIYSVLGVGLALAMLLLRLDSRANKRIDDLKQDMHDIEDRMNKRMDDLSTGLDKRIDGLKQDMRDIEGRLDKRIDGVNRRIDDLRQDLQVPTRTAS